MTKIIAALTVRIFRWLHLEAIVPGGVLGLLGFICLLASAYFAHLEYGGLAIPLLMLSSLGGLWWCYHCFSSIPVAVGKQIWKKHVCSCNQWKKSRIPRTSTILVGKTGIAETDHHPEGFWITGRK